jgi:hypothetical protein
MKDYLTAIKTLYLGGLIQRMEIIHPLQQVKISTKKYLKNNNNNSEIIFIIIYYLFILLLNYRHIYLHFWFLVIIYTHLV